MSNQHGIPPARVHVFRRFCSSHLAYSRTAVTSLKFSFSVPKKGLPLLPKQQEEGLLENNLNDPTYLEGVAEGLETAFWAAAAPCFPAVTTVPTVLVPVLTVPTAAPATVVTVSPAA